MSVSQKCISKEHRKSVSSILIPEIHPGGQCSMWDNVDVQEAECDTHAAKHICKDKTIVDCIRRQQDDMNS